MSQPFDQDAPSRHGDDATERMAKWMVGDRLSCVLHLGDTPLAYRLSGQGHEVVVAGPDVRAVRDPEVQYVRTAGDRLPFAGGSFDAVVVPRMPDAPLVVAEIARVLRADGVLSTLARTHDETLPWVRRLREVVGRGPVGGTPDLRALTGLGVFDAPETIEVASWADLDLADVLQLARETGTPPVDDSALSRVRALYDEYAVHTGRLRLRHVTHCLRSRVRKEAEPASDLPPETVLLDLR